MEQEVLFNQYVTINKSTLDQMKYEVKQRYSSNSNSQHLNVDELLSLKLFTDEDKLQKEFSKAFWNGKGHENKSIITRRRQFYHWTDTLRRAFKYGNVPIKQKLYRGLNKLLQIPSFNPFCGQPTSTTTEFSVALNFSENKGIIIMSNKNKVVCGMDVSSISQYDNESEIWIYDQVFPIQRAMIMLNDKQLKVDFIACHLVNIPHQLNRQLKIHQFMHLRESKQMSDDYITEIVKKK
eukprot:379743_1